MAVLFAKTSLGSVMWPVLLLLLLITFGSVVVMYFRNKLLHGTDKSTGEGFTLDDLHRMRASGEMTDEEYRAARQLIIGSLALASQSDPVSGASQSDMPVPGLDDNDAPDDDIRDPHDPRDTD